MNKHSHIVIEAGQHYILKLLPEYSEEGVEGPAQQGVVGPGNCPPGICPTDKLDVKNFFGEWRLYEEDIRGTRPPAEWLSQAWQYITGWRFHDRSNPKYSKTPIGCKLPEGVPPPPNGFIPAGYGPGVKVIDSISARFPGPGEPIKEWAVSRYYGGDSRDAIYALPIDSTDFDKFSPTQPKVEEPVKAAQPVMINVMPYGPVKPMATNSPSIEDQLAEARDEIADLKRTLERQLAAGINDKTGTFKVSIADGYVEWQYDLKASSRYSIKNLIDILECASKGTISNGRIRTPSPERG
jgi:hypothetical protein